MSNNSEEMRGLLESMNDLYKPVEQVQQVNENVIASEAASGVYDAYKVLKQSGMSHEEAIAALKVEVDDAFDEIEEVFGPGHREPGI